jgi:hypothetical protein
MSGSTSATNITCVSATTTIEKTATMAQAR